MKGLRLLPPTPRRFRPCDVCFKQGYWWTWDANQALRGGRMFDQIAHPGLGPGFVLRCEECMPTYQRYLVMP